MAEYTATHEAATYCFSFPASPAAHIVLSQGEDGDMEIVGANAVAGSTRIHGSTGPLADPSPSAREYIHAEFSGQPDALSLLQSETAKPFKVG